MTSILATVPPKTPMHIEKRYQLQCPSMIQNDLIIMQDVADLPADSVHYLTQNSSVVVKTLTCHHRSKSFGV